MVYYILRLPFIWFLYSVVQQVTALLEYLTALLECLTALLEYIDLTMASIGPAIAGSAGPTLTPLWVGLGCTVTCTNPN